MDNLNISHSQTKSQTPEIDEAVIFTIPSLPVCMFLEGRFWVGLQTIWQRLGPIERAVLLSGETRIFLNDPDSGTYALLDDLIAISPKETQAILNEQKIKMLAMMDGEQ